MAGGHPNTSYAVPPELSQKGGMPYVGNTRWKLIVQPA